MTKNIKKAMLVGGVLIIGVVVVTWMVGGNKQSDLNDLKFYDDDGVELNPKKYDWWEEWAKMEIEKEKVEGKKGCTISVACNYDPTASIEDHDSCDFVSCY